MVEEALGNVRAGLQIAPSLELEQIAFRADDRAGGEPLQQSEGFPRCLLGRVPGRHDRDYTRVRRPGRYTPTRGSGCDMLMSMPPRPRIYKLSYRNQLV